MQKYKLSTIIINKQRKDKAASAPIPENLFNTAKTGFNIILVTPEMLATVEFGRFIHLPEIRPRLFALMIDEVHLLYVWGPAFRPEYVQIGHLRKRFPERTVMIAFTATLREGDPRNFVCRFLGLHPGKFHFVQGSNARYDVKLVVKLFPHGKQSEKFPELDWLLLENGKTLLFCKSIKFGSKIHQYLLSRNARGVEISMYNALNSSGRNDLLLTLLRERRPIIIIATDTLSVGIDIPDIDLSVVIDPLDLDDSTQKIGRVGRDRSKVPTPRGVLYIPAAVFNKAQEIINDAGQNPHKRLDTSLPLLVLASCKLKNIDSQYGDDSTNLHSCECPACRSNPPPNFPEPCTCGGCCPQANTHSMTDTSSTSQKPKRTPFGIHVTKKMREAGVQYLQDFRILIMETLNMETESYALPNIILSDTKINGILDAFEQTLTHEALRALWEAYQSGVIDRPLEDSALLKPWIGDNNILCARSQQFLAALLSVHDEFEDMRKEVREKRKLQRQERSARKKMAENTQISAGISMDTDESGNTESEEEQVSIN